MNSSDSPNAIIRRYMWDRSARSRSLYTAHGLSLCPRQRVSPSPLPTMSGALLPLISFLSIFLCGVPLVLNWRGANIPLLAILCWLLVSSMTRAVSAFLWNGNIDTQALVYCDITTKLQIGSDIALPASAFALALQVYRITLQKSRLGAVIELPICVGFPVVIMALHTIVQGHRFDIYEDLGCQPAIYVSLPSVIILDLPPLIFAALALAMSALALINFTRARDAFSKLNRTKTRTFLNKNQAHYIRLMALTFLLGVWDATVIGLTRSSMYRAGLLPWTTWAEVHAEFLSFEGARYRLADIPADLLGWIYFSWASVPVTCFFVFVFFSEVATGWRKLTGTLSRWTYLSIGSRTNGESSFAMQSRTGLVPKKDSEV
ncbi:STE3-domain-containing protein [Mycena kentingensis (nom. inval.)]|nr:STE3-domain-containing protein [Mycena kentingensis (nom. inval.)]